MLMALFIYIEQPTTTSTASVRILPTTGMKTAVANLAVRMPTPSLIAPAAPCTVRIPRKTVINRLSRIPLPSLKRLASRDNCRRSESWLTMPSTAAQKIRGKTTLLIRVPSRFIDRMITGCIRETVVMTAHGGRQGEDHRQQRLHQPDHGEDSVPSGVHGQGKGTQGHGQQGQQPHAMRQPGDGILFKGAGQVLQQGKHRSQHQQSAQ